MNYPQALEPGAKIAIVSPASRILNDYVDKAADVLLNAGYVVEVGAHAKGQSGSYSGTLQERLADLKAAFDDDSVKAILCSRGGYGVVHLLEYFDEAYLQSHAKWVMGFSDISALHALMSSVGICSIHCQMCKHFANFGIEDESSKCITDILKGKLPEYSVAPHPYDRTGKAEGRIFGGNMAVLNGLSSTKYNCIRPGQILFIEDIGEAVYRVERMLYELRLNGVLQHLKGLVVGQFTEYKPNVKDGEDMYDMIHRMTAEYDYPVAFDFPIGHTDRNLAIIEGANAQLDVSENRVNLKFIR